jgi:hypothetical protein
MDKTFWEENETSNVDENPVSEDGKASPNSTVVVPTKVLSGVVTRYTDNSTSAVIVLKGDKKETKYRLQVSGIVFDAKSNKVLRPSSIQKGSKVKILSLGDPEGGLDTAAVVLMNDNDTVEYSPITDVTFVDSVLYLENSITRTAYKLDKEAKITNALSSLPYELGKLKEGDRVFFYPSSSEVPSKTEDGKIIIPVSSLYVYPKK